MAETTLTAQEFTRQLQTFQSDDELRKIQRYFKDDDRDHFIGVRMLHVFTLAKTFIDLHFESLCFLLEHSDRTRLRVTAGKRRKTLSRNHSSVCATHVAYPLLAKALNGICTV